MTTPTGQDAAASLKSQMLADIRRLHGQRHFPVSLLQLCCACNEVSLLGERCPSCGDRGALLSLSRVLDGRTG